MSLAEYHRKRDFGRTPEPKGARMTGTGARFVVHKHAARRLHYDLRLELDGVLKSWAVTRGPSLDPRDRRLAVEVEDHPLDYGDFEGTIPKGQYGGGAVLLWDEGRWRAEGDPRRGLKKGHLEFHLDGAKLRGRWHLVRLKRSEGDSRDNWLLIKADDDEAKTGKAADVGADRPLSVATGRDMEQIAAGEGKAPKPGRSGGRRARRKAADPLPDFVAPQLARLAVRPPTGAGWIHEIKFDGYRIQARIDAGKVQLRTRAGLDWTGRFGAGLVGALAALPVASALLDGEVVVAGAGGASDFSALQADLSAGRSDRFDYYLFDLLHLDGRDLRGQTLLARKALLEPLVPGQGPLRLSEAFGSDGALVLRHACRLSLEGVVSKRGDAPYTSGRGRAWVKSKCADRQEFVIGGFTAASQDPSLVGSLLLGVHEDKGLVHVGRVGTGFGRALARDLMKRLTALAQDDSPFAGPLSATERRGARFVRPDMVAEVEFRAWTGAGHLRHAAFRGLREDKPASEIRRERAAADKSPAPGPQRRFRLTHPDRVYWPDAGITKADLAGHYERIWPLVGPHVVGRPLALLRAPEGIGGDMFFQKHPWRGMGAGIRAVADPADPGQMLVTIDGLDGLVALVQGAALEIHPWGSLVSAIEKPDRIIMDLDPGEGVDWPAVTAAAREVRDRLQAAGLAAFVKTSGGKGLHVVAPLAPRAAWPAVRGFCRAMAVSMAADRPEAYVATIAKARRTGRILIDWLRNQRGATAVAPWSTRARAGAPVSVPVAWDEIDTIGPAELTLANLAERRGGVADPWSEFHQAARPLPKAK